MDEHYYDFTLYGYRIQQVKHIKGDFLLHCTCQGGIKKGICLYRTLYVTGKKYMRGNTILALRFHESVLRYQRIQILYREIPEVTELAATDLIAGNLIKREGRMIFGDNLEMDTRPHLSDFCFDAF